MLQLIGCHLPLTLCFVQVRLGTENGSKVVEGAVTGLYSLVAILTAVKVIPPPCALFAVMTLPIGKLVLDFVKDNHSDKELIFMAKYYAVRLHVAFGIALILGFSLASRLKFGALW
jgi:1,4-dihydroxy-2-naphthoate octaprenyltransferase